MTSQILIASASDAENMVNNIAQSGDTHVDVSVPSYSYSGLIENMNMQSFLDHVAGVLVRGELVAFLMTWTPEVRSEVNELVIGPESANPMNVTSVDVDGDTATLHVMDTFGGRTLWTAEPGIVAWAGERENVENGFPTVLTVSVVDEYRYEIAAETLAGISTEIHEFAAI